MPTRALVPCPVPRCPNLTAGGRCVEHRRDYEQQRGTAGQRGYTPTWAAYARSYRAAHPICAEIGCGAFSEHVDHIVPVGGPNDPGFWNSQNHRGLCASCHAKKTVREDGGFGNPRTPKGE